MILTDAKFDMNGLLSAWNAHATERIESYYAENAELIALPNPEAYKGRSGIRKNVEETLTGIPDANGALAWFIQQGNKVSALVHVTGTHTGPLVLSPEQTVPATGNKVDFQMAIFVELDDQGKIRHETDVADSATLLMQVGVLGAEEKKSQSAIRH